ncbi:MAG: hypothetical protein IJL76_03115 [Bacilli bacterium]|nr:hypothetical protein [Bacilli bacterium]
MEGKFAILMVGDGTTIVPVSDWSYELHNDSSVELNIVDGKRIYAPKSSTIITADLSLEEVNDLARQLSGDRPISHFAPKSEHKEDLNEMLTDDKTEELADDKTLSLSSNIF